MPPQFHTRTNLSAQLRALGLVAGDTVMVHAGLRSVGHILGGPDSLIGALLDATSPGGTVMVYTDWNDDYHELLDDDGRIPTAMREHIPPFDPASSRARRDNGTIAEFVRTFPGALRSANPGASCAAVGTKAAWLTDDHPLEYGYGRGSPFDKLVEAKGKILLIGAPLEAMSILHHAEHLADLPGKRIAHFEAPLLIDGRTEWHRWEEFDTTDPIVDGLPGDYFATVVEDFLKAGGGHRGKIGNARSVLVSAPKIVRHGVDWLEARFGKKSH